MNQTTLERTTTKVSVSAPSATGHPRFAVGAELIDHDGRRGDVVLFERFLEMRGRAHGPMVWVNAAFMFMDPAATSLIAGDERDRLWAWALDAIADGDDGGRRLRTGDVELLAACRPIGCGGLVGAEISLLQRQGPGPTLGSRRSAPSGWESLRESELGIARLVAEGLTNREVGARLFLSRHTVDSHLRQIYRKLGIRSRIQLTREVLHHAEAPQAMSSEPSPLVVEAA